MFARCRLLLLWRLACTCTHLILDAVALIDLSDDPIKYRPHLCVARGQGQGVSESAKEQANPSSTKARRWKVGQHQSQSEGGKVGREGKGCAPHSYAASHAPSERASSRPTPAGTHAMREAQSRTGATYRRSQQQQRRRKCLMKTLPLVLLLLLPSIESPQVSAHQHQQHHPPPRQLHLHLRLYPPPADLPASPRQSCTSPSE